MNSRSEKVATFLLFLTASVVVGLLGCTTLSMALGTAAGVVLVS
jgi:hypothetical protein